MASRATLASRASSGVVAAARAGPAWQAASMRRSRPGRAGAALRRGRTPLLRVMPSTTMAQVDGAAGQQMRGADRRQRHPDRAHRAVLVGEADHVHGDGVGIGGERFAAEVFAPALVLARGGAVGASGVDLPWRFQ